MRDSLTFVAPSGVSTPLSGLPGIRALGASGTDLPPVTFVEDESPDLPGSVLRQVRIRPRDVEIPVYAQDSSHEALRTLLRTLARNLNPQSGDGRLQSTSSDGTMRELVCRYAGGMEGNRITGQAGEVWRRAVLSFRAFDPYWTDVDPFTATFTTAAPEPFLSETFLPMSLSSDTVLGSQTVDNTGDVEAHPVWTAKGPATGVSLFNDTTGQSIELPVTLTAEQSVVIDTRPLRKTVRRNDGTNLFGSLSLTSSLWSLPPGTSSIRVELPGATSESFVSLVYVRRWLTS